MADGGTSAPVALGRMLMKRLCFVPVALMIAVSALAQSDPWAPLRAFEGKWEGDTSGKPGKGKTSRDYRFELNGKS